MLDRISTSIGLFLILLIGGVSPARSQDKHANSDKVIHAVRANDQIRIDGVLNDAPWAYASGYSDFIQRDPDQDEAPSESTMVQIVYDDEAIYFGITLFDSQPDKIERRLDRRDRPWEGDRISVNIDPYHDHRTGFFFVVNAAGVEGDGLLFDDGNEDNDWDGVWDSNVKITDFGWVVEMKIPYHSIRFTRQDSYTWGVNFIRDIYRTKERDFWAIVRRGESGWVSRFGHIEGIEKISPPTRLQMIPYTVSRGQLAPIGPQTPKGNDLNQRLGGNVKYGLTSNMTLDMAVNPDFGQVEADEAQLNLSTFEQFFPEKRPFFLEGAQIFDTPLDLFYSRRIGRAPSRSADLRGGSLLERAAATDILGAAKLSGRTQGGTTIGLISSVTAQEFAVVADSNGFRHRDMVEPQATYNVLRLKQDVLNNSTIGLIATHAARSTEHPATTGGVDWRLNFLDNMYNFTGQVAVSRTGKNVRSTGMGTELRLAKSGGDHIGGNIRYETRSPGFDTNDLGFQRRSNVHRMNGWLALRGNNPWKFTRRRQLNFNTWGQWNYDGKKLEQGGNINGNIQFLNWWWIGGGVGRNLSVVDDRETRDNGLVRLPGQTFTFIWVESDFRQRVNGGFFADYGQQRDGKFLNLGVFSNIQILPNFQLRFNPRYRQSRDVSRWVSNVDDPARPGQQIPVFGKLDTDNFSIVTRATITFTKDLSFQLYNQIFFAAGDYQTFSALTSPSTFGALPAGLYTDNPDFNNRSMNMNAVFRWEYRPGSTLFFVWAQARNGEGIPGDAGFGRNFRGVFDAPSDNVVLMKLNYWWNL